MSRTLIVLAAVLAIAGSVVAADLPPGMSRLDAYGRMPCILGQPDSGFMELYEFDMWLSGPGQSESRPRRCGAPPYRATSHDGYSPFEVTPGRYAILLHQPEWFVRPAVVPNVVVGSDKSALNVMPSLDYSCVTNGGKLGPWQKPGVPEPWTSAKIFYQTFIARGTSVTHVHFRLAGTTATSARVSIHRVKDGRSPDKWAQVGPARVAGELGPLNDRWVGWRSSEVRTIAGRQYAVRIEGMKDGAPAEMAMLIHRDEAGPGYADGTAWVNGAEQKYDIYGSISSDSDGTVIPYMRVYNIKPGKLGGSGTWSQTWVAQGRSIAAVDLLVAWGTNSDANGILAEFRIREGGPNGKIIGVTKRAKTAWWGPGMGFLGAAWLPGEVPITPGKTYCLECVAVPPCEGYSVGVTDPEKNAYPDGMAFCDGTPMKETDLEMTVTEYKTCPKVSQPKTYEPKGKNLLVNGGFEGGTPNEQNAQDPKGWTRWNAGTTAYWYGKYGRNDSMAARVIGGNINGTCIDGGYVQRVEDLSPNKTYCLSGWTSSSAQTDMRYLSAIGYDPTGQTTDPKAPTIRWLLTGRRTFVFDQALFHGIRPRKDAISIWVRGANSGVGDRIFTVDFDDFILAEEQGAN